MAEQKAQIKERLKSLASAHKAAIGADQKKQTYLAKLKAFFNETKVGDSDRLAKLD